MADDQYLLTLLERALAPTPEEPPDERVAAVRLRAGRTHRPRPITAVAAPPAGPDPWALAPVPVPVPAPAPAATRAAGALPPLPPRRPAAARAGWMAAAASVAAAALVVAFLAVPSRFRDTGGGSPSVATGTGAARARLRIALQSQDPIAVAKADRALLEEARRAPAGHQSDVDQAVAIHSDALVFLRDHPTPDVMSEMASSPSTTPAGPAAGPTTSVVHVPASVGGPAVGAPPTTVAALATTTTVAPVSRSVSIVGVTPRLDGFFEVDYTVAGFTPDTSARAGTWSIRFSFDDGQMPTLWGGSSPWSFPQANGVLYRQVCARVADSAGVPDMSTGGCHSIL